MVQLRVETANSALYTSRTTTEVYDFSTNYGTVDFGISLDFQLFFSFFFVFRFGFGRSANTNCPCLNFGLKRTFLSKYVS